MTMVHHAKPWPFYFYISFTTNEHGLIIGEHCALSFTRQYFNNLFKNLICDHQEAIWLAEFTFFLFEKSDKPIYLNLPFTFSPISITSQSSLDCGMQFVQAGRRDYLNTHTFTHFKYFISLLSILAQSFSVQGSFCFIYSIYIRY